MKSGRGQSGGRREWRGGWAAAAFVAAVLFVSDGRSAVAVDANSMLLVGSNAPLPGEVVREIDDPNLGFRWLLLRDERNPGGPGRLVLAGEDRTLASLALQRTAGQAEENRLHSVIHAGDRLVIEEHTAHMDAILDARALSPAAVGALFAARLTAGGRVVRVMALGPGRAALQAESGVWP